MVVHLLYIKIYLLFGQFWSSLHKCTAVTHKLITLKHIWFFSFLLPCAFWSVMRYTDITQQSALFHGRHYIYAARGRCCVLILTFLCFNPKEVGSKHFSFFCSYEDIWSLQIQQISEQLERSTEISRTINLWKYIWFMETEKKHLI